MWNSVGKAIIVLMMLVLAGCNDDNAFFDTTGTGTEDGAVVLDELLRRAVQEELDAEATYRAVIETVGAVRPFTNIAESEAQHVQALEDLAQRYGVATDDLVVEPQASPSTRLAACELGTAAEEADIALYDELLPQVQGYPDVVQVLTNLRRASLEQHLPAFERCS